MGTDAFVANCYENVRDWRVTACFYDAVEQIVLKLVMPLKRSKYVTKNDIFCLKFKEPHILA